MSGLGKMTSTISPSRAAAFEILMQVGSGNAHSDELLHSARLDALTAEDRNLTTALVMGVLRWQIALDARIAGLLSRPDQKVADPVALALRLGAFQLLHMDRIPAHAALNESVELCRAAGHPHATGMVNAVLRKLVGASLPRPKLVELPPAFAERLAHPQWLVERWTKEYGRSAALAICEYDQNEPPEGTLFAPQDGDLPQMDDGSRLVAEIAAASLPRIEGQRARVWDCCAAPGGKTLILAKRMPDAEILASDVSAKRLTRMEFRMRQFAYAQNVRCEVADAANETAPQNGEFDLILCDVPCSGTGTLARNPEIRLRLRQEELVRLAKRQRAILEGALRHLAPGGRLIYSTCSLEPEENESLVEQILIDKGLHKIAITPALNALEQTGILKSEATSQLVRSAVRQEALRTLPGVNSCDGFFTVVAERN